MQTWSLTNGATITVVHTDNLVQTTYNLTKSLLVRDFPELITASFSPAMVYLRYNSDGVNSYKFDIAVSDVVTPVVDDGKELYDKLVDWITPNIETFTLTPLATVDLVNQQAAIPGTALFTPTEDGFYQVSYYASVTQPSDNTGTLGGQNGFTITSTDADSDISTSSPQADVANAFVQTQDGNSPNRISGVVNCWAKSGVSIDYAFDYTSDGGGGLEMQYNLHIVLYKL